jgi:diacylglycerol kinase
MKPKYNIKNNFLYAMDGAKELFKENAFKIEIIAFILAIIILFFLSYPLWAKLFMFASLFVPLIAESFNTAIEKVVDLAIEDFHKLAKDSKDIAAFGVFLSLFVPIFVWFGFIFYLKGF